MMSLPPSTDPVPLRARILRPSPGGRSFPGRGRAQTWVATIGLLLLATIARATHYERTVFANTQWTDTGINFIPGKTYLIHDPRGRWSSNTNNPIFESGPDGFPNDASGPNGGPVEVLMENGNFGDLIMFIGADPRTAGPDDARLFPVRTQVPVTYGPVTVGGRFNKLWLGFNDTTPDNNGGSVVVQIDVDPPVPTYTDCSDIPGIVTRWRGEGNPLDSVGTNHLDLANAGNIQQPDGTYHPSTYYTNGLNCRALYLNGNGGGAFIRPARELEFEEGEDFTFDVWIKLDSGDFATKGNMVLLDRRSRPVDKYYLDAGGNPLLNANGEPIKEGELSVGYLFSLFREGNERNGRWLLECQINTRERLAAGLINTNHHSSADTPILEVPGQTNQAWHQVVVSVKRNDPQGGRFYVDGKPYGTFDPTPYQGDLTPLVDTPLRLGLHARDYYIYQYKGAMDDFAIYRRALSAEEVRKSYEAGLAANCCRNVGITITNAPQVNVGEPFEAKVRLTRTFGRPPVGLVITNDIPKGLRFLSAVPQVGNVTTNDNGQVLWNVGAFGTDETVSLRLQLSSATTNTYVLRSSVGYTGGADDNPADDSATSSVESAGTPKCQPLAGLVGWWPGNSTPQDIVSTNSGTLAGTVGYVPAVVGSGFNLDGSTGAVRVGQSAAFQLQDLTIEAWIRRGSTNKATANGNGGFLFAGDTGGYGFGLMDDGRLMLSQVGLSIVASSGRVTDADQWHHVAVSKSGTAVVFYLDGTPVTRTNLAGRFVFNRPFALGALGGTIRNVFLGAIDELAVYDRALTEAEVQAITTAGPAGKCRTGLADDENPDTAQQYVIHYQLDELSPDRFFFVADPDRTVELETSTNLVTWTRLQRIANPLGEIRGLINPTNQVLFYRLYKKP